MFPSVDLPAFVASASYGGIFLVVLLETGLLLGFFLPGDSLLIAVGLVAATGQLDLPLALGVLLAGAVLGNNLGFGWGRRFGSSLRSRVRTEHLERALSFQKTCGAHAVVFGPFLPMVRTLIPFLSGASGMPWHRFLLLNAFGSMV